jgi:biopolymer transport protein ExbD
MDDPRRARDRIRSEINIAPLVDVCLVLLIIFMVVTPMLGPKAVELPKSHDPGTQPDKEGTVRISLTFGPPPEIFIGDGQDPLTLEALRGRLKELAGASSVVRLVVRADRHLAYAEVKRVLGAVSDAGFHLAGLVAEREQPGR